MALYDGYPSIRLEGDKARSLALIPRAKLLLHKVQKVRETSGCEVFQMTERVDDASYIRALSAGNVNTLFISSLSEIPDEVERPLPYIPYEGRPTIYSGATYSAIIEPRQREDGSFFKVCTGFAPTDNCVLVHKDFDDDIAKDPTNNPRDVRRLAVTPWDPYTELKPPPGSPLEFSQYTLLRSSMYSGTMMKLVQAVMGLGKVDIRDFYSQQNVDSLPAEYIKYLREIEARGVQVRYDYKHGRTHGVTRDNQGNWWLVEIGITRGVLAMPLPLLPGFSKEYLLRVLEDENDEALRSVVELFGGIPTGQGFTGDPDVLADHIQRGDVLQLLEPEAMGDFYRASAYSSSCGWAFNADGSEAHNVGYFFDTSGYKKSVWYSVTLNLSTNTDRQDGEPVGFGSASLVKQREGFIWAPTSKYGRYLPVKYHEPLLPGLLSVDGAASDPSLPAVDCDTPIYVGFDDGDELLVGFYHRDTREREDTKVVDETEGEECLYSGSWTITETGGTRRIPPGVYTNKDDPRSSLTPYYKETTIESRRVGYNPPRFSDFLQAPEAAIVTRSMVFQRDQRSITRSGEAVNSAFIVPQYVRNGFAHAWGRRFDNVRETTSTGFETLQDPNVGYAWRNFPRIGPIPWPAKCEGNQYDCGGTGQVGGPHKERRIVCLSYQQSACSDFADSGEWLSMCQVVDSFNDVPTPVRQSTSEVVTDAPEQSGEARFYTSGFFGYIEIPNTDFDIIEATWAKPSPDPDIGTIQQMEAVHNTFGSQFAAIRDSMSGNGTITRGVLPDRDELTGGVMPGFIGVVE